MVALRLVSSCLYTSSGVRKPLLVRGGPGEGREAVRLSCAENSLIGNALQEVRPVLRRYVAYTGAVTVVTAPGRHLAGGLLPARA